MKLAHWYEANIRWVMGLTVAAVVAVAALTAPTAATVGCSPASVALETRVEQIILDQLAKGGTLEEIEALVKQIVPQGADVDVIISAAIDFLHAIGVLPPSILPRALAIQTAAATKLAAKKVTP